MKYLLILSLLFSSVPMPFGTDKPRTKLTLSKAELYDKIKGGWAGQFIGVTYAAAIATVASSIDRLPNENVQWPDGYQLTAYTSAGDQYDDIFIDLTFLEAIREHGVEVTPKKLSEVYLKASYKVGHGCKSARYNLSKGKSPQRSGYWLDNPHADDNDFQSHADFIGLIYPALPISGSHLSHKVGHLMNYGDGYYGGLYVATLYSLAFTTTNPQTLVSESLQMIPDKSSFHRCVSYAMELHKQFPYAWDRALGSFQRKWKDDFGCPDRLIGKEDAEAKVNSAYLTLALLYGEGDFEKTLQIMRSIRRADCNVSTVSGILGVMSGFEKIPEAWKQGIEEIETQQFHQSNISLADAYDITMMAALKSIKNANGRIGKDEVVIAMQTPSPVKLEKSFEGHYAKEVRSLGDTILSNRIDLEFEGIGFVLRGMLPEEESDEIMFAELYLNNKYIEVIEIPFTHSNSRPEFAWKFQLPHDKYQLSIRPLKNDLKHSIRLTDLVVYDVTPN